MSELIDKLDQIIDKNSGNQVGNLAMALKFLIRDRDYMIDKYVENTPEIDFKAMGKGLSDCHLTNLVDTGYWGSGA